MNLRFCLIVAGVFFYILAPAMALCAEPTKASQSAYVKDMRKATTSKDLTKADLAWHAVNTYGWDCEEVWSRGEVNSDGYFFITCSSGKILRVYPRPGQHPKITASDGSYK